MKGRWLISPVAALVAAFLLASLVFVAYGKNPIEVYRLMVEGSLGSSFAVSETVRRAVPLLIIGAGLALSFRALFWNIGAEGQILMGAVGATWTALFSGLPTSLLLPAMFVAGFLVGAMWGVTAAVLRSMFKVNEIITTLMMNYIAAHVVLYLIHGPWRGKEKWGFAYTDTFPESIWLTMIPGSRVAWLMVIMAVGAAVFMYFFIEKSVRGYEIRVTGASPSAARFAGISYGQNLILVMIMSGGLGGLAGVGEVAGNHHLLRHPDQISLGYGYAAIIVAWLARTKPLAVILSAMFFGALYAGGDTIRVSMGIPLKVTYVFNGLVLLCLIAFEYVAVRLDTRRRQR